ncbi:MAG: HD domain-containing protein [bacterium]|nr:HD domain-containing protein [bacterium]
MLRDAGGRAWLVGGSVRDSVAGLTVRDLDLEVFGLAPEAVQTALATEFELDLVGRSFGILKLKGVPLDVGLPRRETKLGTGHQGFTVEYDPHITLPEAAARRDFTMNAVYLDPLTGQVEDPFDGVADLQRCVLRHTSPAFTEDPLRVLRGMQLAARFDLETAPATVALCRTVGLEGLARERVFEEWRKLLVLGRRPSRGLQLLADTDWLRHFPELDALRGVPQDPVHHPEGDVWIHTCHCLDACAAEKLGVPWEDLVVGLAVLCHDLGKPSTTTQVDDGRTRALGHEQAGVAATGAFLSRLTDQRRLVREVLPLVAEHMRPTQLYQQQSGAAAIRRLADRVGRIDRLVRVARADNFGRPPLPADSYPAGDWLLERAAALGVTAAAPEPLVMGRHLLDLGAVPGPDLGRVLDACYQAQLDGTVPDLDTGLDLARRLLAED